MSKYLKNMKTGVVLTATPILLKRDDLRPCTQDGKLIGESGEHAPATPATPAPPPPPGPPASGNRSDDDVGNWPTKDEVNAMDREALELYAGQFGIQVRSNSRDETLREKIIEAIHAKSEPTNPPEE